MQVEEVALHVVGKGGVEQDLTISDDDVTAAIGVMRNRGDGTTRLLAWQGEDDAWHPLRAEDVNDYLSEVLGSDLTAKDFRTWHATVHAAVALAASAEPGDTKTSRRRAVKEAVVDVSESLGNTPTIARTSYVDPRVIEQYEDGVTIVGTLRQSYQDEAQRHAAIERAVARLIDNAD